MNVARLRGEIVAQYKTQRAFAACIGWNPNKLSKMMQGKYRPDTDEVASIVSALDLSERQFCDIFLPRKSQSGDEN